MHDLVKRNGEYLVDKDMIKLYGSTYWAGGASPIDNDVKITVPNRKQLKDKFKLVRRIARIP